jgi:phage recombination protein Bet
MSAVLKQEHKDLGSLFGTFTQDQIDLIKTTVCKNSTDNELKLFLYTAKHAGLDPLLKQIYAIKRGNSMTIQTSIDGFRAIAERTGMYSPGDDTKWSYNEDKSLLSATAYVKKMTRDGTWHQVSSTAFFQEYAQSFSGRLNSFWSKGPHMMLAKCAESNALRKAFPFELGSLYSTEEMNNGLTNSKVQDEFLTEEVVGQSPKDEVKIDIPEGADPILVAEYILYLAHHYEQTTIVIKQWLNEKSETFWKTFHKWVEKHHPNIIDIEENEPNQKEN